MQLKNEIMLITYADSLGSNLKELGNILENDIKDAVGGVHILPFFPSSADRGFAPMRYDRVSPEFGTFADVERIGKSYYLMFDFMINHISRSSNSSGILRRRKTSLNTGICLSGIKISGRTGSRLRNRWTKSIRESPVCRTRTWNLEMAAGRRCGVRSVKNRLT